MTIFVVAYVVIALLVWGFLIGIDTDYKTTDAVMAVIWPVAVLLLIGYALGQRK